MLRGCGRCHGEWRGGDRLSFACRKKYPAFSGKAKVPAGYEVFRRDTQTAHIYGILKGLLAELGGGLANIVKLTTFYVNPDDFSQMAEVRKNTFNEGHVAASSAFCVTALAHPDALVEVEAIAILDD